MSKEGKNEVQGPYLVTECSIGIKEGGVTFFSFDYFGHVFKTVFSVLSIFGIFYNFFFFTIFSLKFYVLYIYSSHLKKKKKKKMHTSENFSIL